MVHSYDVADREELGDGVVDRAPEVELGEREVVVDQVPARDEQCEVVVEDRGHVEASGKKILHHEATEGGEHTVDNVCHPESTVRFGRVQAVHEEHEAERERRVELLGVVRDRVEQRAVGKITGHVHSHVVVPADRDSCHGSDSCGKVDDRVIQVNGTGRCLLGLLWGLAAGHVVVVVLLINWAART